MEAAVAREKRERRNLAMLIAVAVNQPGDIDKVAPEPREETVQREAWSNDQWWEQ